MPRQKRKSRPVVPPQPGWAVYLRTSSDENQKPELSRARQRFLIDSNVLEHSELPVIDEYIDVLTGKSPKRDGYQRLLRDARAGKFSRVIVERADRFGRNDTEALRAIDELNDFGVAVRFANSPDLDPMDPDDRVIVALSFTLARRESALLGIRVKGGLQAKRLSGGWCGRAPDGYKNLQERTSLDMKYQYGRFTRRIEIDPDRAPVWREAWNLLLEDELTLEEIAETLHARGYCRQSGKPFVEVLKNGKRKPNISTLSNTFHNWAYAGWIISKANGIRPKAIRGNWEPLVTTEEFERGLTILSKRNELRKVRRKHDYLLSGIVYFRHNDGKSTRLTCSTSNAGRSFGGTAYYRIARTKEVSFLCSDIDAQVSDEMNRVQIDPELIPLIRTSYTYELGERMGYSRPDERSRLEAALKQIDEEETRTVRLLASGKISEAVWDGLWAEWQDRRYRIQQTVEALDTENEYHVENLETALKIISQIGVLYNGLERSEQKELLRQAVERVVVNEAGTVTLEMRTPFAYLRDLADEIRHVDVRRMARAPQMKNGRTLPAVSRGASSNQLQVS